MILPKVEFSALGHNSEARWVERDGRPSVELSWWAGGIRVVETFSPSVKSPDFDRIISLTNSDMAGNDTVRIGSLERIAGIPSNPS